MAVVFRVTALHLACEQKGAPRLRTQGPSPRRSQCLSPLGGQHLESVRPICGSFV